MDTPQKARIGTPGYNFEAYQRVESEPELRPVRREGRVVEREKYLQTPPTQQLGFSIAILGHFLQTGIISPSKLRMKLMGSSKKRDGSNNNSSRTSPVRMEDSEFLKNSLLASTTEEFGNEGHSLDNSSVINCSQTVSMGNSNGRHDMMTQQSNSSAVHPLKYMEDENLDYDSNASSASFEFHRGERAARPLTRSFSGPMSYKWNDAEKWIVNKQSAQSNHSRVHSASSQGNRMPVMNMVRVAPETAGYDARLQSRLMDMKWVDLVHPQNQMILEKFSFAHAGALANTLQNLCPQTRDLKEIIHTKAPEDDTSVNFLFRLRKSGYQGGFNARHGNRNDANSQPRTVKNRDSCRSDHPNSQPNFFPSIYSKERRRCSLSQGTQHRKWKEGVSKGRAKAQD